MNAKGENYATESLLLSLLLEQQYKIGKWNFLLIIQCNLFFCQLQQEIVNTIRKLLKVKVEDEFKNNDIL